MTIWDLSLARRAALIGAVALATSLIVVAATDAGGPWSLRLGMTAALAPLCGALGTLTAVRVAEARGELRALAAVGADPWRVVAGAVVGGSAVGLVGPAMAAMRMADLAALFPRAAATRIWVADGEGTGLVERTLGIHIGAGGALVLEAPRVASEALPAVATWFALLALAAAAVACPGWLVMTRNTPRRIAVGGMAATTTILAFQGVAAGRLPAFVLSFAPAMLMVHALAERRA